MCELHVPGLFCLRSRVQVFVVDCVLDFVLLISFVSGQVTEMLMLFVCVCQIPCLMLLCLGA